MALPVELVSRLDFQSALEAELAASNKLLPNRWDRRVLQSGADDIANNIRNRLTKGLTARRADVIFADKNRRGARPISEMPLIDRTAYRALVDLIASSLPETLATRATHKNFRELPLAIEEAHYVTLTDVTSFYEFVDHDILAQELEAQSGEGLAVDALMSLLYDVMGRKVGIPQIHRASDVLGDTYIDVVRRRMLRAGHMTFTYSDDFRIVSETLAQAKSALELCAREARDIGLALNESKTFTFSKDKYEQSLEAFSAAEQELFSETDLREFVSIRHRAYEGDDIEEEGAEASVEAEDSLGFGIEAPEDDDAAAASIDDEDDQQEPSLAQQQAARRALQAWTEARELEHAPQLLATAESLLGVSLPIMGAAGLLDALPRVSEIMRYAPSLTPAVAGYMTKLGRHGQIARRKIRRMLDELTAEDSFSTWQHVWIAEMAGSIRPARNAYAHYAWLQSCLSSDSPSLAAVSASALGRLRKADVGELTQLLDRVGPAWRSLVLWGLAKQASDVAAAVADDKIERLMVRAVTDADGF